MNFRNMTPRPLFMADDGGGSGGGSGKFSADYVARLQSDLEKAREDLRTATTSHGQALADLKQTHTAELATLRQQHDQAMTETKKAGETALAEARTASETALAEANKATRQRMVSAALRAEAKALGLVDDDGLKLLDQAEIEKLTVDDSGNVVGAKPLIEGMKKAKPFLFGQSSTSNPNPPPQQQQQKTKSALEMTDEEFSEATRNKAWRKTAA